jgi:Raf kinase inhibitor-like YbhB/YbcL family protein
MAQLSKITPSWGPNDMRMKSHDFEEGALIPSQFTCDGVDLSPELHWEDAPAETKSFALGVTDSDAPMGTFVHWLVYSIPKGATGTERNRLPAGARQVTNDFGRQQYGGPCPPSGTHRYYFRLYALDSDTLETVTKTNFFQIIEKHAIATAELMGRYTRKVRQKGTDSYRPVSSSFIIWKIRD